MNFKNFVLFHFEYNEVSIYILYIVFVNSFWSHIHFLICILFEISNFYRQSYMITSAFGDTYLVSPNIDVIIVFNCILTKRFRCRIFKVDSFSILYT